MMINFSIRFDRGNLFLLKIKQFCKYSHDMYLKLVIFLKYLCKEKMKILDILCQAEYHCKRRLIISEYSIKTNTPHSGHTTTTIGMYKNDIRDARTPQP